MKRKDALKKKYFGRSHKAAQRYKLINSYKENFTKGIFNIFFRGIFNQSIILRLDKNDILSMFSYSALTIDKASKGKLLSHWALGPKKYIKRGGQSHRANALDF